MSRAEDIARAFHEAYEQIAPALGYQTRAESAVEWERVPIRNRAVMIATVAYLLERQVIRPPLRKLKLTQVFEVQAPSAVAADLRDVAAFSRGLDAMYAAAHSDVFAAGGSSELGVGHGSVVGVDPTGERAIRGSWRRGELRLIGESIRAARNALWTSRSKLRELTAEAPQPKKVDPKAFIEQSELDEQIARKAHS